MDRDDITHLYNSQAKATVIAYACMTHNKDPIGHMLLDIPNWRELLLYTSDHLALIPVARGITLKAREFGEKISRDRVNVELTPIS
jgi:hypothetical protein